MILPARWYAGGKGLDDFRNLMLEHSHIRKLIDVSNSADCFPGVNIAGGICYFLWEKNYNKACKVINLRNGKYISEFERRLDEYEYFVRNNIALTIIRKVLNQKEKLLKDIVFSRNYFGLPTTITGSNVKQNGYVQTLTSKGIIYINKSKVSDKDNLIDKYKVIITYAMSGGNKPTSEGNYQILSSLKVLFPGEVCTETYLILDTFDEEIQAKNMVYYATTKFFRFLLLQALSSIHITKDKFCFVPLQDFTENSDIDWTKTIPEIDKQLYAKYGLTDSEVEFIESMIKSME